MTYTTESEVKTIDEVFADVQMISNKLNTLQAHLVECEVYYANVAVLPRAAVNEDGYDTVFDPLTSVKLIRLEGKEAALHAIEQIDFQYRSKDGFNTTNETLSQIAARRSVGIVHLKPNSEEHTTLINDLVAEINTMKRTLKQDLQPLFANTMQRTRLFYKHFFPDILPKSITKLIRLADADACRIHFSWLNQGYTTEKMDRKRAIEYIDKINSRKLSNNPELGLTLDQLNKNDIQKLGNYQKFYRIFPAKMNPRQQITRDVGGNRKQMQPQRAVSPILYIGEKPLEHYGVLHDLNTLDELRKCSNKARVEHLAAIEAYGLYCFDTVERQNRGKFTNYE
ncbi:DNA replication terminus site-binding protein [Vibrio agarivorans]|uniref:DNA replication terminus site-binding protein n=1 Tax=Vibrio agarivorans TaxID=153622 RepID=UPI0025B581DF|nr:DNA replication terminus site-binding protein [Vibrio agarivorans]MDN3661173.1 DNA replication terminus site-binding protein [Vibrio agarivorans]